MKLTYDEAIKEMGYYSEKEYGKGIVSESHKMAENALNTVKHLSDLLKDGAKIIDKAGQEINFEDVLDFD